MIHLHLLCCNRRNSREREDYLSRKSFLFSNFEFFILDFCIETNISCLHFREYTFELAKVTYLTILSTPWLWQGNLGNVTFRVKWKVSSLRNLEQFTMPVGWHWPIAFCAATFLKKKNHPNSDYWYNTLCKFMCCLGSTWKRTGNVIKEQRTARII